MKSQRFEVISIYMLLLSYFIALWFYHIKRYVHFFIPEIIVTSGDFRCSFFKEITNISVAQIAYYTGHTVLPIHHSWFPTPTKQLLPL